MLTLYVKTGCPYCAKVLAAGEELGFEFNLKNVADESRSVERLNAWYENKFLSEDIVTQMKDYWEKQKDSILPKNISDNIRSQLVDSTDKLHSLEKEWQEIYFNLLSKVDEIREEEKNLKQPLGGVLEGYKRFSKHKKK